MEVEQMDTNRSLAVRELQFNVLPNLKTGDIILTSSKSMIVNIMNLLQDDRVNWGHVLIVGDDKNAWEAGWKLQERDLNDFFENKEYWRIFRKKDITENQRNKMKEIAPKLLGNNYGFWRLFLQLLDHIFKTNNFTNYNKQVHMQVCSSFVAWLFYETTEYKFNDVNWESCDPDDIEDDYEINTHNWDIIAERLPNRCICQR